ncbi:MAG: 2-dehydropantoate 2-reductase [Rhodospirillales bacterium]|nr:MAG: 2-dehydropantoate 2-reductase [Rhodospirillales bacterium]
MTGARVCVVGAGAVGGLMAVKLAQAGADVSVLARGAHLHTIRRDGLTLIDGGARETVRVDATDDAGALGPQSVVIVALKAQALVAAAASLAPLVGPSTVVMPAMNGVPWWFLHEFGGRLAGGTVEAADPGGAIARAIPSDRVVGAVVHLSSSVAGPGVIRRGRGGLLLLGEPSRRASARLDALVALLSGAGFDARPTGDIQREVWLKLWGNMNMNPISALTGSTADAMLDDPLVVELVRRMMDEATAAGRALGIDMDMDADGRIAVTRELGAFKTSMLQDLEAGKALELDAILAAPCEIGERLGVPMPYSRAVLGLARQRAANAGLYAYEAGGRRFGAPA